MSTEYTRAEAAKLHAIEEHERFIDRLQLRSDIAKRVAAMSKRQLDHAVAELREIIKSDAGQQRLPGMETEYVPRQVPTWQDTPVSVVIGEKGIVSKLEEFNIKTLGQLAAYTNADQPLTRLGLTEMQEAKVIESLQIYWTSNPNEAGPASDDIG